MVRCTQNLDELRHMPAVWELQAAWEVKKKEDN